MTLKMASEKEILPPKKVTALIIGQMVCPECGSNFLFNFYEKSLRCPIKSCVNGGISWELPTIELTEKQA